MVFVLFVVNTNRRPMPPSRGRSLYKADMRPKRASSSSPFPLPPDHVTGGWARDKARIVLFVEAGAVKPVRLNFASGGQIGLAG